MSLDELPHRIYDEKSLKNWLDHHSIEPSTGQALKTKTFHVNLFAKNMLSDYRDNKLRKGLMWIQKLKHEIFDNGNNVVDEKSGENLGDEQRMRIRDSTLFALLLQVIDKCLQIQKSSLPDDSSSSSNGSAGSSVHYRQERRKIIELLNEKLTWFQHYFSDLLRMRASQHKEEEATTSKHHSKNEKRKEKELEEKCDTDKEDEDSKENELLQVVIMAHQQLETVIEMFEMMASSKNVSDNKSGSGSGSSSNSDEDCEQEEKLNQYIVQMLRVLVGRSEENNEETNPHIFGQVAVVGVEQWKKPILKMMRLVLKLATLFFQSCLTSDDLKQSDDDTKNEQKKTWNRMQMLFQFVQFFKMLTTRYHALLDDQNLAMMKTMIRELNELLIRVELARTKLESKDESPSEKVVDSNGHGLNNNQLTDTNPSRKHTHLIDSDGKELFKMMRMTFSDLISHFQAEKFLNHTLASKYMALELEWLLDNESLIGDCIKSCDENENDDDFVTSIWSVMQTRKNTTGSGEREEKKDRLNILLKRFKTAIELDPSNLKCYQLMARFMPQLSSSKDDVRDEDERWETFMINQLMKALEGREKEETSEPVASKPTRIALSRTEEILIDLITSSYQHDELDMILTLNFPKPLAQQLTDEPTICSSDFELAGLDWMIEVRLNEERPSEVTFRLKCLSSFSWPVRAKYNFDLSVLDHTNDDGSDSDNDDGEELCLITNRDAEIIIESNSVRCPSGNDKESVAMDKVQKRCRKRPNDEGYSMLVSVVIQLNSIRAEER